SSQTQERIGRLTRLRQSRKSLLTGREASTYTRFNRGEPACAAFLGDSPLAPKETKLNRLARERRGMRKSAGLDNEPTVEDHLARIEEDIRRLKVEFDIYFNGGSKRPPYDTKLRVESHLKRLGDDRSLSFAQRYHYNTLATRYNGFREVWRRTMKDREEGRDAYTLHRAARE